MKLRVLESALQDVSAFAAPKVKLEQYPTPPDLASKFLFAAESEYQDIHDARIVDLGCGCGMLSIAAGIMGAESVVGIDVDSDALEQARQNIDSFEDLPPIKLVNADISRIEPEFLEELECDVCIMNPPFGTKIKGIDAVFLDVAFSIAKTSVYSLHKSSTRSFILKKAERCGWTGKVVAQMRFDLPKTFRFHKQDSKDIFVDLFRFEPAN